MHLSNKFLLLLLPLDAAPHYPLNGLDRRGGEEEEREGFFPFSRILRGIRSVGEGEKS